MLSKGFSDSIMQSAAALNMLNTRYFILGKGRQDVLKNPHALGTLGLFMMYFGWRMPDRRN
jgi:chromosome segregation and condensation protein ScpB